MRNSFILSAMAFAALTMVGCAQDDVVHESPSVNNAIQFGTYIGRAAQTRASVVDLDVVRTGGFGVFAFYTGLDKFDSYTGTTPNFMNNQEVTWQADPDDANTGTWTYTPVKYWPNNEDDKVSFFAYAPYDSNQTWNNFINESENQSEIKFEVAPQVKDQKDFLWSKTPQIDKTKQNITEEIKFDFGHALARIGFSLAGAFDQVNAGGEIDKNTVITVRKVMLHDDSNWNYSGLDTTEEPGGGAFYKDGYLDLTSSTGEGPAWSSIHSGYQNLSWDQDDFAENGNIINKDSDLPKQLNSNEAYAMVIPQEFNNGSKLYVYIEYEVETTDTNVGNNSKITNYISKEVNLEKLEAGKAYTLNLVLGMTTVKLSTDITDWDPSTEDVDVDLPENTAPVATTAA